MIMSIRIMIFLVVILSLPASASVEEKVWAAKSSGFIKSDEIISFENYSIKAKVLDDTKATVTVYKGNTPLETSDFNINQFKIYDTIGVMLLGIKNGYSWVSISKLENKEVWRPLSKTLLKWGEKYAVEGYTIDIDTYGTDSVNLTVSNKSITETDVFSKDDFRDYKNLRIALRNIDRTGFIELEFFTNKAPEIKAEMITDKDEYFPDENVAVTINIASDVAQNIVGITLESNPSVEIKPSMFSASNFGSKSFYSQIDQMPPNSTITVTAKIETRDYYNNPYVTTLSKNIIVTPDVAIVKLVPQETDDENVPVQLYVRNSGASNKSIHVQDSIPEELAAKTLDWDVELEPKSSTTLTYTVTPRKPGTYMLPAATASWDGKSSFSKRVRMTMHMPYIVMNKTALLNKSLTDVKLVISNIGDRPAKVKANDDVPAGYSIVSGEATWSGKIEGGESIAVNYTLQGNIENLPAASAIYYDIRGVARQAKSNTVVKNAQPLNVAPSDIISFMVSSFMAIAGVILGITVVAYLLVRRR